MFGATCLSTVLFCSSLRAQEAEEATEPPASATVYNSTIEQKPIFTAGGLYKYYRIPSLITTPKGTIIAICEGRSFPGDSGRIDLLQKTSVDGGATWSPSREIIGDTANTWSNPCPVVDKETGRIFLFMSHNLGKDNLKNILALNSREPRTIWVSYSDNEGQNWSRPENISSSAKNSDWVWTATGPGVGIQLSSGRLVIPCNYIEAHTNINGNYVVYSDDHGANWKRSVSVSPNMNEAQVVQLSNGNLLLNSRPSGAIIRPDGKKVNLGNRIFAQSSDQGLSWSAPEIRKDLKDPACQGSTIKASSLLIFSNPQGPGRSNMTIHTSADDGKSWQSKIRLCEGSSGYSCLSLINPETVGCLYEAGRKERGPEALVFAKIPLSKLRGGT